MRSRLGVMFTVTGFLACPCHLPLTLPLLLTVVGGTSLGLFLQANPGLIVAGVSLYFLGAIGAGLVLLSGPGGGRRDPGECCVRPSGARENARRPTTGESRVTTGPGR